MPGLRPTPPEPNPEDENTLGKVNFGYITMQTQTGEIFFAMTFQQIIAFLSNIANILDEDEDDSAIYRFNQINDHLRKYLGN
jgi:hypothetical protein